MNTTEEGSRQRLHGKRRRVAVASGLLALVLVGGSLAWRSGRTPKVEVKVVGPSAQGAPSTTTLAAPTGSWKAVAPAPLTPRLSHSVTWTGKEMIVCGGYGRFSEGTVGLLSGPLADGAAYDPASDQWRVIAPAPLSARWGHAAVWTGRELLVVGGYKGPGPPSLGSEAAAYNPDTNSWRELPQPPVAQAGLVAAWVESHLLVVGFSRSDSSLRASAEFEPSTGQWRELPSPQLPKSDERPQLSVAEGQVVALGKGGVGALLDRSGTAWIPVDAAPVPDLDGVGVALGSTVIFCVYDRFRSQIHAAAYSIGAGAWRPLKPPPVSGSPDSFTAALAVGEHVVFIPVKGHDFLAYEPAQDLWWQPSPSPLSSRYAPATSTGSAIFVWGGGDAINTPLGDGALLLIGR